MFTSPCINVSSRMGQTAVGRGNPKQAQLSFPAVETRPRMTHPRPKMVAEGSPNGAEQRATGEGARNTQKAGSWPSSTPHLSALAFLFRMRIFPTRPPHPSSVPARCPRPRPSAGQSGSSDRRSEAGERARPQPSSESEAVASSPRPMPGPSAPLPRLSRPACLRYRHIPPPWQGLSPRERLEQARAGGGGGSAAQPVAGRGQSGARLAGIAP